MAPSQDWLNATLVCTDKSMPGPQCLIMWHVVATISYLKMHFEAKTQRQEAELQIVTPWVVISYDREPLWENSHFAFNDHLYKEVGPFLVHLFRVDIVGTW